MANRNPIATLTGRCVALEPLTRKGTDEVWGYNVVLDQGRGVTVRCTAYPEIVEADDLASSLGQELSVEVEVSPRSYTKDGQQRSTVNYDVLSILPALAVASK